MKISTLINFSNVISPQPHVLYSIQTLLKAFFGEEDSSLLKWMTLSCSFSLGNNGEKVKLR